MSFDCLVVVSDVNQAMNSPAEREVLELVKTNKKKKYIPAIFVSNKIDDVEVNYLGDADVFNAVRETFGECQTGPEFDSGFRPTHRPLFV